MDCGCAETELFDLTLGARSLRDRKRTSSRRPPCSKVLAVGCLATVNHKADPIRKALGEHLEDTP